MKKYLLTMKSVDAILSLSRMTWDEPRSRCIFQRLPPWLQAADAVGFRTPPADGDALRPIQRFQ